MAENKADLKKEPKAPVRRKHDPFFRYIFLFPEKTSRPLDGNTPDLFFYHYDHLILIIQQIAAKRKMKNY